MKRAKNQPQATNKSWHIVEQTHGRVKPAPQGDPAIVNTNTALEHEAALLARRQ